MTIEDRGSIGSDEQQSSRPAEEAGTKKHQTADGRPMSGRPPKHESRATEFRRVLIIWRQTPESMRPSLRVLADKLSMAGKRTTHQILSYHLNRLGRWQAKENAKRIRARAKAENREMTMRECLDAIITPRFLDKIDELRQEAKRGPLNSHQIKMLKLFARQFPEAQEILQNCRQLTPEEEKQARAFERKAMFTSAALNHIERIKQEAERGPLPWRDIKILKTLARRKCAEAKELLQKYSKSALPRPQVPQ